MRFPSKENYLEQGYVPLGEYVKKLQSFTIDTGWKIPMTLMDRVHVYGLTLVSRFSWFSDSIYIQQPSSYGIGFTEIISYFKKFSGTVRLQEQSSNVPWVTQSQWRMFIKNELDELSSLSFGVSQSRQVALSKALGEGFERYFTLWNKSLVLRPHKTLTLKEMRESNKDFCFPPAYHKYTAKQAEKNGSLYQHGELPLAWVKAVNAHTQTTAYLPKQLISRQCQKILAPVEGMLQEVTTSGGAGWFTTEGAVLRGLFELIQRDAFLVTWLKKGTLPAVDMTTISSPEVQDLLEQLTVGNTKITILKGDAVALVPTAIVILFDDAYKFEQVSVTAHAAATFAEALLGALEEASAFFYEKGARSLPADYQPFVSKGIGRDERINLYSGTKNSMSVHRLHSGEYISFAEASSADLIKGDEKEVLSDLLVKLRALGEGYTPYYFEYKHPLLQKTGYHVVKCFVPKLFPLYLQEHLAPILSERLDTADKSHVEILKILEINPHPFP